MTALYVCSSLTGPKLSVGVTRIFNQRFSAAGLLKSSGGPTSQKPGAVIIGAVIAHIDVVPILVGEVGRVGLGSRRARSLAVYTSCGVFGQVRLLAALANQRLNRIRPMPASPKVGPSPPHIIETEIDDEVSLYNPHDESV